MKLKLRQIQMEQAGLDPADAPIWMPSQDIQDINDTTLWNTVNGVAEQVSKVTPTELLLPATSTSALPLLSASATESPTKEQGRTVSEVSVSFTKDPSDTFFDHVRIWFVGYQGQSIPWLMTDGTTSPVTFTTETTGETVTVLVQPVSKTGIPLNLALATSCTVVLDGVVSAPPAPTVTQQTVAILGGYQFTFATEAGLLADVISGYNIYRSTTDDPTTATRIDYVAQNPKNLGSYVYQDHVGGDRIEYYWVSAINTSGLESTLTPAQSGAVISGTTVKAYGINSLPNPSFETNNLGIPYNTPLANTGTPVVCDGWYVAQNSTYWKVSLEHGGTTVSGSNNLLLGLNQGVTIPADSTYYSIRVVTASKIPVSTGDYIRVSAWLQWDSNTTIPTGIDIIQRVGFYVYAQDGSFCGELVHDVLNAADGYNAWGNETVTYQIPALLGGLAPAFVVVEVAGFVRNSSGSPFDTTTLFYADLRFDDVKVITQLTAFDLTPLNTSYTDNSLSTILSNDGTSTVIHVGSFQIQYGNGLRSYNSGTVDPGAYGTYYVYMSDPTYSGGAVAFLTTQVWSTIFSNNGNILLGNITTAASTSASGGGGGGATSTTHPICFLPNVKLMDGKPISEHKVGDYILTNRGMRRIRTMHCNQYKGKLCHMGGDEWVTEQHAFIVGVFYKAARELWPPTRYYEGEVWNLEIDTEHEAERNYFLANGMLSHNMMFQCDQPVGGA